MTKSDSSSPLKVLFLASSYPRSPNDSASVFLRYLADALAHRGVEVHVLVPADASGSTSVEDRVTVHRFQYFPVRWQKLAYGSGMGPNLKRSPWLWLQVPFFLGSMFYALLCLLRVERPDLVHAHWIIPQGFIAIVAKWFCKIPVVTTGHGTDVFAFRGKIRSALKRMIVLNSDAWTTNTEATAMGMGRDTVLPPPHIIPMGVDIDLFAGGRREVLRRELANTEFLILFVGRLIKVKGCHSLLEAAALLPPSLAAHTTFWIVGNGDQKPALENMAKNLGIENKVRFWGTISNRSLPNFYAAADLLVVPSMMELSDNGEGQAVVLLEAFAGKTCVVATRIGGIPSIVEDKATGVLVEPGDAAALAAVFVRLHGDPELRAKLAKNGFVHVKEKYPWKKIAGEFETLYLKVLLSRQA